MRNLRDKLYGLIAGLAIGAIGIGKTYQTMHYRLNKATTQAEAERIELLKETTEYILLDEEPTRNDLESIVWFKKYCQTTRNGNTTTISFPAGLYKMPAGGLTIPPIDNLIITPLEEIRYHSYKDNTIIPVRSLDDVPSYLNSNDNK